MKYTVKPDLETFKQMARMGNVIPVFAAASADMDTPLALFCKFPHGTHSFFLESIEGNEPWSRFSLFGIAPRLTVQIKGNSVVLRNNGREERMEEERPMDRLKEVMDSLKLAPCPDIPGVPAGFMGYFSYESFRYFEQERQNDGKDSFEGPDVMLMFADDLLLYDRFYRHLYVIHNVRLSPGDNLERAYEQAVERIWTLSRYLHGAIHEEYLWGIAVNTDSAMQGTLEQAHFEKAAREIKGRIAQGELERVMLAQRWFSKIQATPVNMYRALRYVNPVPYGYYLKMAGLEVMGTSLEAMVRMDRDQVILRAVVAGSRRFGEAEQDDIVAESLLGYDPHPDSPHNELKRIAAQMRQDLTQVAEPSSIRESAPVLERTMRTFRLGATLKAQVRPGVHMLDLVAATIPNPAACGTPREQAMKIIDTHEKYSRGIFGGAVGYLGLNGKMDLVTADCTVLVHKGKTHIQVGVPITGTTDISSTFSQGEKDASALFEALNNTAIGLDDTE